MCRFEVWIYIGQLPYNTFHYYIFHVWDLLPKRNARDPGKYCVKLMLKERQKLPNPQADTKLPLPDRVIYNIHFNRKYIQESDAAILKLPYFPVRVYKILLMHYRGGCAGLFLSITFIYMYVYTI